MNIRTRRLIAIVFFLIFIIVTPTLILYTAGYRYNIKKQKLNAYGSLVIKTEPSNAQVTVSGLEKDYSTPARINNLNENSYTIDVTKDGYFPWRKTLPVLVQETTFAEDIILFKNQNPTKYFESPLPQSSFLPNSQDFTYLVENTLYYFNIENKKADTLFTFTKDESLSELNWSKDNNNLLIHIKKLNKPDYFVVINKNSPANIMYLPAIDKLAHRHVRWSPTDDGILYTNTNNIITKHEIVGSEIKASNIYKFEKMFVNDFIVNNNDIYFVAEQNGKNYISKLNIKDPTMRQNRIELTSNDYTIDNWQDQIMVLFNENKKQYTFLQSDLTDILLQKNDLLGYKFNTKNNTQVLLFDQSEITIAGLDRDHTETTNIYRVSQGLIDAYWYPETNYILFNENHQLKIIELDPREKRLIITTPVDKINTLTLTNNGKQAFIINQDNELYQLDLTD